MKTKTETETTKRHKVAQSFWFRYLAKLRGLVRSSSLDGKTRQQGANVPNQNPKETHLIHNV